MNNPLPYNTTIKCLQSEYHIKNSSRQEHRFEINRKLRLINIQSCQKKEKEECCNTGSRDSQTEDFTISDKVINNRNRNKFAMHHRKPSLRQAHHFITAETEISLINGCYLLSCRQVPHRQPLAEPAETDKEKELVRILYHRDKRGLVYIITTITTQNREVHHAISDALSIWRYIFHYLHLFQNEYLKNR